MFIVLITKSYDKSVWCNFSVHCPLEISAMLLLNLPYFYSVLRFSLSFSSMAVVLERMPRLETVLGLQYKHIGVKGEYTLPHFGQIQPCCPNIPLYGFTALDSVFIMIVLKCHLLIVCPYLWHIQRTLLQDIHIRE